MWKSSIPWSAVLVSSIPEKWAEWPLLYSVLFFMYFVKLYRSYSDLCQCENFFNCKNCKIKNISYSAFHTIGLNVDICLGCTSVWIFFCIWCQNCACHYRKGMLSSSPEEICQNILPMVKSLSCSIIMILYPIIFLTKALEDLSWSPLLQFQHYI